MASATYNGKQVYSQDRSTTYWFNVDGLDQGTGVEFDGEEYGIAEQWSDDDDDDDGENVRVACDGSPQTEGDRKTIALRNTIEITDEMRQGKKEV